jgi:hypothetical protein
MKTIVCKHLFAALAVISAMRLSAATYAQGPLTPPGPPAPMMKTLEQIEPRTAITTMPYSITQPGSYYLTTNLTGVTGNHGIVIFADNVTLDMNGFTLFGVPGAGRGIVIPGVQYNITVGNGTVRDWPFDAVSADSVRNSRFERLRVSHNGGSGITVGDACAVVDCLVMSNAVKGISVGKGSVVRGCTAQSNGDAGITTGSGGLVADCAVVSNALDGIVTGDATTVNNTTSSGNTGKGIVLGKYGKASHCVANGNSSRGIEGSSIAGVVITSCLASGNGNDGIYAGIRGLVSNCESIENAVDGIDSGNESMIVNNLCARNTQAGIKSGGGDRVEGNHVSFNGIGIDARVSGGLIIRNSANGNATNFIGAGLTVFGPTNGLISAGILTNQNPWANISY